MGIKDNMQTLHIIVKGKVQGVFFRASAREAAMALALTGWVKNTSDGAVEISVTGNSESLQSFLQWCHEGPPKAVVQSVITEPEAFQSYEGFQIKR